MPNRKKRIEKGIESTKEEIKKHEKKKAEAEEVGDEGLVRYYDKEIKGMEDQIAKKKEIIEK